MKGEESEERSKVQPARTLRASPIVGTLGSRRATLVSLLKAGISWVMIRAIEALEFVIPWGSPTDRIHSAPTSFQLFSQTPRGALSCHLR